MVVHWFTALQIMVMADGRVAEYASPEELLADPNSMYSALTERDAQAREHARAAPFRS